MKFSILNFLSTAIPIGTAIAVLTALINVTPNGLVGAVWYGFPRSWLIRLVIAPQYYPWRIDVPSLAIDIAFWCAVSAVIQLIGVMLYDHSKRAKSGDMTEIASPGKANE